MRRRVHQSIALDQSLRQSRTIWLSLAVMVSPFALLSVISLSSVIIAAMASDPRLQPAPGDIVWALVISVVLVAACVFFFGRVVEATRRLRQLHEDPGANVKPLPAPFQASLFGPYH